MSARPQSVMQETEEQKTLGLLITTIVSGNPDLAEALSLCAIPHSFNKEILAWLRGEGTKPSKRTETILEDLKSRELAFAKPANLFLHDNVRNLLLHRWRTVDPEDFKKLNGEVVAYYEQKLQQPYSSDEQRVEWEREQMYHLLVADKKRGIDCLKSLCNKAIGSYRLSTLDLLLTIAREHVDAGIQHWIQFFEGKKFQVSGEWKKAIEVWEKLKKKRASFIEDLEPTLAVHLSILYKDMDQWDKATECLAESLKILEGKPDQHGIISILNNRGFFYKDRADLKRAESDFRRGLEISKEIEHQWGMAVSLKNLGLLYKDNNKWDEAFEHFDSSLAILERMGDECLIARGYDDRGLFYKDRGLQHENRDDLQKAENDFTRALEILGRVGDEHEKAAAFNSVGLFYKDRGLLYKDKKDLQKAENNFQRALEILETIGDKRRIADIFNCLGFLSTAEMEWHDANAHFELALTNFREALTILNEIRDERGTAAILNNLGLLYQHKGEYQPAINYFQQSLVIVERVGDKMNAATTMYELASLYEGLRDYNKAIELLNKVVRISEGVGNPDSRIRGSREKLDIVKAKATSSLSVSDQ